jgi:hypothetical protein
MRKMLSPSIAILIVSLLIISQATQMVKASNPMFSTVIKSPTNSSYSTGLINLETVTVGLTGHNVYYSTSYSLDGRENVTVPFSTESHEKSFQITMEGFVALPLLTEGSHSITVYQEVEANSTPPMVYWENYTVNFSVAQQANATSAPSSTPTAPEFPQLSVIGLLAVASFSLIFFKRRKSKTA